MRVSVKESSMVRPIAETPSVSLWLSNLDLVMPTTHHTRTVYFYRSNGADTFFDVAVLKDALARVLVDFYPYAGRLEKADDGRIQINCNAEGVLFVEADCDAQLDDLGGFSPRPDLALVPNVDYSHGISSFPILLLQLTRFECGSVCLGVLSEHHIADGFSALHFINTWSDIARSHTAAVLPFLDRRVLSARVPPQPQFSHAEYQPPPPLKTPLPTNTNTNQTHNIFTLTRDFLNTLKHKCNRQNESAYTTFEAVTGHVWRCVCAARGLPEDQETKLQISIDGRARLQPQLPPGFLGNGVFFTTWTATYGELVSNPVEVAAEKVHAALVQMDDEYLRSALDYLELQLPNNKDIARSERSVKCPNFGIATWVRLPFYEADYGWGKPVYAGPGGAQYEGKALLFADGENDGSMLLAITLLQPHMDAFQKLLYHI
ncbi:rosmarinate synthase-like [Salvia hispanica]|uniref:rosmarinate synthase-like n=1 Tax=Salvia hispanica TaxID=49212 RepID=UPI0020094B07|nr:rosmarinate synthase-like [Salvia hispanica]